MDFKGGNQALHSQNLKNWGKKYIIEYTVERLPIFSKDEEEYYEKIFMLISILAETDQLKYF
jgi:hypothetical protein